MHDWGMMNWGWGWGGMIFQLLFWFVIIGVIIWGIKYMTDHTQRSRHDSEEDAIDILKKRYARGEIDKKEFDSKKKDLLE
ncbi:SHOCT domain-containing protein [bacterium]|nr:SHOCT domain-containing protein [bacterium]